MKDASAQVEDTAQLFLGLRIQCARCHHHPFEKWSQQDYYGFAAFFAQVGRKQGDVQNEERIFHKPRRGHGPESQDGPEREADAAWARSRWSCRAEDDPRHALADWMAGQGQPVLRPVAGQPLLEALLRPRPGRSGRRHAGDQPGDQPGAARRAGEGLRRAQVRPEAAGPHDLHARRRISSAAEPNEYNQDDKQNFSRYYPKRLNAEVLLDAIDQVTGTQTSFDGMPAGTRAVQLPDNGFNSYFLTVFGRPEASQRLRVRAVERGEPGPEPAPAQLQRDPGQADRRQRQGSHAWPTTRPGRTSVKIRELYLLAFAREPTPEEMTIALAHINKNEKDPKRAYEDIVWALINTKEFLFNH